MWYILHTVLDLSVVHGYRIILTRPIWSFRLQVFLNTFNFWAFSMAWTWAPDHTSQMRSFWTPKAHWSDETELNSKWENNNIILFCVASQNFPNFPTVLMANFCWMSHILVSNPDQVFSPYQSTILKLAVTLLKFVPSLLACFSISWNLAAFCTDTSFSTPIDTKGTLCNVQHQQQVDLKCAIQLTQLLM